MNIRNVCIAAIAAFVSLAVSVGCGPADDQPVPDTGVDSGMMDIGHDATDAGDGGMEDGGMPSELEVAGTWISNFGTVRELTSDSWGQQTIVEFSNEQDYAITRTMGESGETYSKLVWTQAPEPPFYYCTVDFGLESAEAARNTDKTADASNPSEGGCGMFAWTKMRKPIEITGRYDDQFDNTPVFEITPKVWNTQGIGASIVDWSNEDNWAITQNPEDAEFSPEKYNRIVWIEPEESGLTYYCTVDFGLDTEEAARNSMKTADPSNPEMGGCGSMDSPWTRLMPVEGS